VGALNLDVFFRCQIEAGFPTLSSSAVAPHDRRSEVRNEIRGKSFVCCGQWTGISCGCINLVLMVASCLLISHRSLLLVLPLGLLDKASRTAPHRIVWRVAAMGACRLFAESHSRSLQMQARALLMVVVCKSYMLASCLCFFIFAEMRVLSTLAL
jgi:hypothetical protein